MDRLYRHNHNIHGTYTNKVEMATKQREKGIQTEMT